MALEDRNAAEALRLLRQVARRSSLRAGPVRLGPGYLRLLAAAEALPENRDGTDKSWVGRADAAFRAWRRSARIVR
jgi:hypothetical protein